MPTTWIRPLQATVLLLLFSLGGCTPSQDELVLLYSESLGPILREVGSRFEKNNPSLAIRHQSLPDLELLQRVREGASADLIAVADSRFLERILAPDPVSRYWLIGGDELVLAATREDFWDSPAKLAAWERGWIDLIFQRSLEFAIVDPNRDALGYFTKLAWKLAELHYDRQGLYRSFLLRLEDGTVAPDLETLVARLMGGEVDLIFTYRSVAVHRGFKYLRLPPQVSLSAGDQSDFYQRVFERVEGPDPAFSTQLSGAPIRYAFAPLDGSHAWTRAFLAGLRHPESLQLFRALGYLTSPVHEVDLE